MRATPAEQALSRALDYLADNDVRLDTEIVGTVVSLLEEGLLDCPHDILAWLMAKLPEHYDLPAPTLPPTRPPLRRTSIGYPDL